MVKDTSFFFTRWPRSDASQQITILKLFFFFRETILKHNEVYLDAPQSIEDRVVSYLPNRFALENDCIPYDLIRYSNQILNMITHTSNPNCLYREL